SEKINQTVRASLQNLLTKFQMIHICGQNNVEPTYQMEGYVQFEYINQELKDIFAITDFVLSRAGANAIFEFLSLRIPMLLIPLSLQASRGDQIVNAKSFKKSGYAHVLEEENLNEKTLVAEAFKLKDFGSVLLDHMKEYKSEKARDRVVEIIKKSAM